jgi:hypothetical protein
MKALIIPFPEEFVYRKKQLPLSKLMIVNLLAAYALESQGVFFGPRDIKGSLTRLINRDLIIRKDILVNGKTKAIWHVSYEAIETLKDLGIDVVCVKPRVKSGPVILFLPLVEMHTSHTQTMFLQL